MRRAAPNIPGQSQVQRHCFLYLALLVWLNLDIDQSLNSFDARSSFTVALCVAVRWADCESYWTKGHVLSHSCMEYVINHQQKEKSSQSSLQDTKNSSNTNIANVGKDHLNMNHAFFFNSTKILDVPENSPLSTYENKRSSSEVCQGFVKLHVPHDVYAGFLH